MSECILIQRLEVDHIIPRGGSGQGNIENLQLLCAQVVSRQ